MVYVLDANSFIVLGHYFPKQFPSFWDHFEAAVSEQRVLSTREVYWELDNQNSRPHLREWVEKHKDVFLIPTPAETEFVARIFAVPHFRQLVAEKQRLRGGPVADPFVIAAASVRNACVVTEEALKDNAAKIPNVCQHFGVRWRNLEGFMAVEGWRF